MPKPKTDVYWSFRLFKESILDMSEDWIFTVEVEVYVKLSLVSSPNVAKGLSMHPCNRLYPLNKGQSSDWNFKLVLTDNFLYCSFTSTAGN